MQLWNDYEGRTIAEAYPLKKLLRPEGRSAFFLTTNGTGTPAMVRLIEAHFDEPEILSRWRMVSEIKQENLVEMRKYGETMLDGTPLVYAVMEPTEMSLADLLRNRTVSVEEAKQLAYSLIQALTALHARGLVHEHLQAENVLAAGETIKLRSDCVREAASPDGDEAEAGRRKAADAHDLAALLLQAMTGRRALQGSATVLSPPFDAIIRNGLSDKWGLSEMAVALGPVSTPKPPAPIPSPAVPKANAVIPKSDTVEKTENAVPAVAANGITPAKPEAATPSRPQSAGPLFEAAASSKVSEAAKPIESKPVTPAPFARSIPHTQAPDVRHRIVKPVEKDPRRTQLFVVAAIAILVLLFFGWRLTRSGAAAATDEPRPAETAKAPATTPAPAAVSPAPVPAPVAAANTPSTGRTQWHVVAYTYNHEDQARKKAAELKTRYPALNPDVFSPTGRSPYLVTVGGSMSREDALAFRRKARSAGLPRDTYAQNYAR